MKTILSSLRALTPMMLLAMAITPSQVVYSRGHIDGNGGDYVRGTFIKVGQAVMGHLQESEAGSQILKQHGLDAEKLSQTLSIDVISVDAGTLIDNGGSAVDAIGAEGEIKLSKNLWSDHFEKSRDVYYLVFHEMLRAVGVNDDNYVISGALNPFPESRRVVTRLTSVYPLLGEDNLSNVIVSSALGVNGSGCVLGRLGTSVEVDLERNQIELSFRNNIAQTGGQNGRTLDRKNCALSLPVSLPAGKRLVISQVDMMAKLNSKSISKSTIALEAFLSGSRGVLQNKVFEAGEEPMQGRLLLRKNDVLQSTCGGADLIRLNTSSVLQGARVEGDEKNQLEVDRITLSLKIESCESSVIPIEAKLEQLSPIVGKMKKK